MSRLSTILLLALVGGCSTHLPVLPHTEGDVSVLVVEGMFPPNAC
jgi:hypothetical protein